MHLGMHSAILLAQLSIFLRLRSSTDTNHLVVLLLTVIHCLWALTFPYSVQFWCGSFYTLIIPSVTSKIEKRDTLSTARISKIYLYRQKRKYPHAAKEVNLLNFSKFTKISHFFLKFKTIIIKIKIKINFKKKFSIFF